MKKIIKINIITGVSYLLGNFFLFALNPLEIELI